MPASREYEATQTLAPLTLSEMPQVLAVLPIAFMSQDNTFVPVAVMGLHSGHNLYINPEGGWDASYRPTVLGLHPFKVIAGPEGQPVICVDEHSVPALADGEGEAFFDASGQPSAVLQQRIEALREHEEALARTTLACAELQRHDLLQPWDIDIPTPVGMQSLQGLYRVDEAALNGLPAQTLALLQACGAMALAHAQLFSVVQLDGFATRLIKPVLTVLANPHRYTVAAPAAPVAAPLKRVLLVTHEWTTLMEMAALVKRAGCMVDILCPAHNTAIRNGFYDGWIDSGPNLATLLLALVQLSEQDSYDEIVIGDDPILWAIYHKPIAALLHHLPFDKPEARSMVSKIGFAKHCAAHGIASPNFVAVATAEDVPRALATVGLPLVLKANYSNGGHGVQIIRDEDAYWSFWSRHKHDEAVLVEAFIEGALIPVEALFRHGRVLEYAVSVDTAATLGPSTQRRYLPQSPELGDLVSRLGESAGLHGFANMGFMQETASGRYYLIESDMRPNKWVALCHWFGHDFAAAFQRFMADDDLFSETAAALPADACREIEFFPSHTQRLLNEGRLMDTVLHLLDFQRTWRYLIYDPVQLEDRMSRLRQAALAAIARR